MSQGNQQKSGVGLVVTGSGEYRQPLPDDFRLRLGSLFYRASYVGHADFDDMIARVYAGLGQNDEAMRWLEKAYLARSAWLIQLALKVDSRWDALRSDARFQDLLRRIGFPS